MNNIARLLMIKEAVASWNIEHPDRPMTITEYLKEEALSKKRLIK